MEPGDLDRVVGRVVAGDVEAYAGIVEACQEDVWRAIAPLLFDREATKDLVQDTFVRAYAALGSYRPGSSFTSWLRTIARNLARNAVRERSRRSARLEAYRRLVLAEADVAPGAADGAWRARRSALARCRQELPAHGAELLELHYERALSQQDIAGRLGRTVEAVRQALWRLRMLLRDCVQKRTASP